MPAVTLNAIPFAGNVYSNWLTTLWAPTHCDPEPRKIGEEVDGIDGTLNVMLENSGTPKIDHVLVWEKVSELTRAAVYTAWLINTTFTAILPQGTFTKQNGLEDYDEEHILTLPDGQKFFKVTLKLRDL